MEQPIVQNEPESLLSDDPLIQELGSHKEIDSQWIDVE